MSKKIKEIAKNLCFSFFSVALPTVVLQFLIQPMLAANLGAERNGQYLTLMSLNYFMVGITGGVLSTVRMLRNQEYEDCGLKGDFNVFMIAYAVILTAVLTVGHIFYTEHIDFADVGLYVLIGLLYLYHNYIICQYRLRLQYHKILINNIVQVIGYFAGYLVFAVVGRWQIVLIGAYLLSGIYDYVNTDFIREPICITNLFKGTQAKVAVLTVSTAFGSVISYCDKLLLYPMLGGTQVSIYSTASLVGKMLILMSAPINSVILSYIVKMDRLRFKINKKMIGFGAAGIVGAYTVCLVVGYPLVSLLYPGWAEQAHRYIPYTVLIGVLSFVAGMLNTVVIRFCKTYYQIIVQSVEIVIYLTLSLILLQKYSLMGYCAGVVICVAVKILFLVVVILRQMKIEKKESDSV
jgi:O-antigen/teichoic acid export membrane protein